MKVYNNILGREVEVNINKVWGQWEGDSKIDKTSQGIDNRDIEENKARMRMVGRMNRREELRQERLEKSSYDLYGEKDITYGSKKVYNV